MADKYPKQYLIFQFFRNVHYGIKVAIISLKLFFTYPPQRLYFRLNEYRPPRLWLLISRKCINNFRCVQKFSYVRGFLPIWIFSALSRFVYYFFSRQFVYFLHKSKFKTVRAECSKNIETVWTENRDCFVFEIHFNYLAIARNDYIFFLLERARTFTLRKRLVIQLFDKLRFRFTKLM